MSEKVKKQEIIIYQGRDGGVELRADIQHDTIWASQDQIAELFDTTKQNIGLHIKHVFKIWLLLLPNY